MSIFSTPIHSAPSSFLGLEDLAPDQNAQTTEQTTEQTGEPGQSDPAAEGDIATQDATSEQTSDTTATQADSSFISSITPDAGVVRRPFGAALFQTLRQIDAGTKHDRSVKALHSTLGSLSMITAFNKVASEYNLSAPLVAAFNATPGFEQAVKSFPSLDSFNLHPSHPTSSDNLLGLESFAMAETQTTDAVTQSATAMADAFSKVLDNVPSVVSMLQEQIAADKIALESSDMSDEVLASMSANLVDNSTMMEQFNKFDHYLSNVESFNVDDLRAHPEQVMTAAQGVAFVADDAGPVLGLTLGKFGLENADRDARFEASQSEFGAAGYTKADLMYFMDKSDGVLEQLKTLSDRKEELTTSISQAITDMPAMVEGNDVSYGGLDHVLLMNCYTTLHTKLVNESVLAVTMLMAAVDSVVDIDTGVAA